MFVTLYGCMQYRILGKSDMLYHKTYKMAWTMLVTKVVRFVLRDSFLQHIICMSILIAAEYLGPRNFASE